MFLVVGLGNPGRKYEHTRHNVGFDVVDILSQKYDIPLRKSRCKAITGEGVIAGQKGGAGAAADVYEPVRGIRGAAGELV